MRIDPSSVNLPGSKPIQGSNQKSGAAASSEVPAPHFSGARSGELQQLVNRAVGTEEVRTDVVEAAKARLKAGAYSTVEAAEKTVDAFLEAEA
ncbi:MAG: hypothetical protein AB8G99_12950 [Planctomycetaceae bacterium]